MSNINVYYVKWKKLEVFIFDSFFLVFIYDSGFNFKILINKIMWNGVKVFGKIKF